MTVWERKKIGPRDFIGELIGDPQNGTSLVVKDYSDGEFEVVSSGDRDYIIVDSRDLVHFLRRANVQCVYSPESVLFLRRCGDLEGIALHANTIRLRGVGRVIRNFDAKCTRLEVQAKKLSNATISCSYMQANQESWITISGCHFKDSFEFTQQHLRGAREFLIDYFSKSQDQDEDQPIIYANVTEVLDLSELNEHLTGIFLNAEGVWIHFIRWGETPGDNQWKFDVSDLSWRYYGSPREVVELLKTKNL